MKLVELTEMIVKELVTDPESITVKEFPSEEENTIIIQVMVPEDQMGRVIGKEGKMAKALRTIVQASSYINDNKRVNILRGEKDEQKNDYIFSVLWRTDGSSRLCNDHGNSDSNSSGLCPSGRCFYPFDCYISRPQRRGLGRWTRFCHG